MAFKITFVPIIHLFGWMSVFFFFHFIAIDDSSVTDKPQVICFSIERHLGCFQLLPIINDTVMNIPVFEFWKTCMCLFIGVSLGLE